MTILKENVFKPTEQEAALWEKEFLSGNDRATVIVVAARLDALLEEILTNYFLPPRLKRGEEDQLLARMRPLSSFSARIYIARRLGIINDSIEDALHIVRDLRNTMAHKPFTSISFNESPHKEKVQRLAICFEENDIVKFVWATMLKENSSNFAGKYRIMMMMLLWALTQASKSVARIEPKAPMSLRIKRYKRVHKVLEQSVERLKTSL